MHPDEPVDDYWFCRPVRNDSGNVNAHATVSTLLHVIVRHFSLWPSSCAHYMGCNTGGAVRFAALSGPRRTKRARREDYANWNFAGAAADVPSFRRVVTCFGFRAERRRLTGVWALSDFVGRSRDGAQFTWPLSAWGGLRWGVILFEYRDSRKKVNGRTGVPVNGSQCRVCRRRCRGCVAPEPRARRSDGGISFVFTEYKCPLEIRYIRVWSKNFRQQRNRFVRNSQIRIRGGDRFRFRSHGSLALSIEIM